MIGPQHQRHVRERRRRPAEGLVEQQLPWRVGDVILAANDVRDPHQRIVDDDGEVVGRDARRIAPARIADDVGVERHSPRTTSLNDAAAIGGRGSESPRLTALDARAAHRRGTMRGTGPRTSAACAAFERRLPIGFELLGGQKQ